MTTTAATALSQNKRMGPQYQSPQRKNFQHRRFSCLTRASAIAALAIVYLTCSHVHVEAKRCAAFAPQLSINRYNKVPKSHDREYPLSRESLLSANRQRLPNNLQQQELPLSSSTALSERQFSDDSSQNSSINPKLYVPLTLFISLSLATFAAFTNLLPGPPIDATAPPSFFATLPYGVIFAGSCDPYSPSLILRDVSSTIFSSVAAALFVKSCTYPTTTGQLQPRDARKIVHTLAAPLFVLVWPLFSNAYGARVFAAIVPVLFSVRLFIAGTGGHRTDSSSSSGERNTNNNNATTGAENELAKAISRSGDIKEALEGPLFYNLVLFISTFLFWTDSPIGVVSVATMAVGDGLADLVGRRFGSTNKWWFNKSKSMAGSAAFTIGSFVGSLGLLSWLIGWGVMDPLELSLVGLMGRLAVIAVVCAAVELVPLIDDNWSVPFSAAVLAAYLLN